MIAMDLIQCALWHILRALHNPEHLRNTKDFLKIMVYSIAVKLRIWADDMSLPLR